jgi:Poly(ADP-ribose) polymerase and DNA-Ligase Zn-finger region
MPHVIEPAPTGRAKCRGCGEKIGAGELRFGESLPNPFAEGESFQWSHVECGAMKRPESFLEALAATEAAVPDKERLEGLARQGVDHPRVARVTGAERDPSGRAQCRHCKQKIEKGAWRIALTYFEDGRFTPAGSLHVPCAGPYFETTDILPRVKRFAPGLTEADRQEIEAELAKPGPPAAPPAAPAAS